MKNTILTGTLCLMVATAVAQTVDYKEIDFQNDASTISTIKVKTGSRYGIRIINLNKKLYIIDNTVTNTSYHETPPALFEVFSKAELPGKTADGAALASGNTNLVTTEELGDAKLSPALREKLTALNNLYSNTANTIFSNDELLTGFGDAYREIRSILTYQNNLTALQNNCELKFDQIRTEVVNLTRASFRSSTMEQRDRASLASADYNAIRPILIRYFDRTIEEEVRKRYEQINIVFAPSKREQLSKDVTKINATIKELIAAIEKEKPKDAASLDILKKLKTERDGSALQNLLLDKMDRYAKVDIVKLNSNMETFATSGQKDVLNVYDYFTPGNWTYVVDAQPIENDLTVIAVNIKPKDAVSCSITAKSYAMNIKAKGGIKIDFSTGLFTNFGGNDFKDQTYRYEPVEGSTTQQQIVKNENKNSIFPSVGALMHVYGRTGNDVKLAGTFGLSTKDLEKINYHLGGSLILGTSKRFILSAGATLTKASLITDEYHVGQTLEKAIAPAAIPTASFNRFGFFAAFTYNLTAK
ncbi:hypothetical protein FFJ24_009990 [Pedobacter sp. KBS0701]|uniref:hypothetical protein n=1 Tax=Pedobacter sp. KBS0701 TaxID=2578106 RepID=UPI00110D824D|nr:hypothetical protein [Pedobacter sp. KBS0701]QDW25122.1 hypothetical protein FFJ24_009990 [Pedobacter sp. KBS0701]